MQVSFIRGFARVLLGALAVFFAYNLGRATGFKRRRTGWILRTAATLAAVFWGHGPDLFMVVLVLLCGGSFGLGYFLAIRPKYEEDLVGKMFDE
jgi:hypothetical protein